MKVDKLFNQNNIIVRKAKKCDLKEVRRLIQELADFLDMSDGPKIDARVLEIDGFENDSEGPLYGCIVAEDLNKDRIVGYVIYFYLYDCFKGRYLHLEDICVTQDYRKFGLGARLYEKTIQIAVDQNCACMKLECVSWNPARKLYEKYDGVNISETEGVSFLRCVNEENKIKKKKCVTF